MEANGPAGNLGKRPDAKTRAARLGEEYRKKVNIMYSFLNDYSETAHPAVLKAILDTNMEQCVGYGMDEHCQNAICLIKEKMNWDNADIHFIPGGTQANLLATAAFLRLNQAVICADSGHIHCHECASVEATGHKLLIEPAIDGKLTVEPGGSRREGQQ